MADGAAWEAIDAMRARVTDSRMLLAVAQEKVARRAATEVLHYDMEHVEALLVMVDRQLVDLDGELGDALASAAARLKLPIGDKP